MTHEFNSVHIVLNRIGFAGIYSISFGMISALAGYLFVSEYANEDWLYLWVYTGLSGLITAYFCSKFFIERKQKYNAIRLLTISIIVGILSHWLNWHLLITVNYIQVEYFGYYMYDTPTNPFEGLFVAVQLSFISLMFFGWTAIPISACLIFLTQYIIDKLSFSNHADVSGL